MPFTFYCLFTQVTPKAIMSPSFYCFFPVCCELKHFCYDVHCNCFIVVFFILNDFIRGHAVVQNKLNFSSNSGRFFLYLNCKCCQSFFFFFLTFSFHALCVLPCLAVGSVIRLFVSYLALYFQTELIFLFNSCVSSCHQISSQLHYGRVHTSITKVLKL